MEEFDTANGVHANWPADFFARIVDAHLARTNNRGGLVGDAQTFLLDAPALLEFSLPIMKAVAADAGAAASLVREGRTSRA
jgi:hypothetical protein